ncbi:MAG: hypothetical protein AB1400_04490 [Pseudomonadota bacterium]|jgi:glycopeptide antibiotics resistance protein
MNFDRLIAWLHLKGEHLQGWVGSLSEGEKAAWLIGSILFFPFLFFFMTLVVRIRMEPVEIWLNRIGGLVAAALSRAFRRKKHH